MVNVMMLNNIIKLIHFHLISFYLLMKQGRRNSVIVGKAGFDELYIFSPGSNYKWYGKYAYICTGPSAMLKPVILGPEGVWRGAQYLQNPNN